MRALDLCERCAQGTGYNLNEWGRLLTREVDAGVQESGWFRGNPLTFRCLDFEASDWADARAEILEEILAQKPPAK